MCRKVAKSKQSETKETSNMMRICAAHSDQYACVTSLWKCVQQHQRQIYNNAYSNHNVGCSSSAANNADSSRNKTSKQLCNNKIKQLSESWLKRKLYLQQH